MILELAAAVFEVLKETAEPPPPSLAGVFVPRFLSKEIAAAAWVGRIDKTAIESKRIVDTPIHNQFFLLCAVTPLKKPLPFNKLIPCLSLDIRIDLADLITGNLSKLNYCLIVQDY